MDIVAIAYYTLMLGIPIVVLFLIKYYAVKKYTKHKKVLNITFWLVLVYLIIQIWWYSIWFGLWRSVEWVRF